MTDKQLFRLCKKYGVRALSARRKFMGLLPEVWQRELWRRRGFSSIYEMAAKLAGLSRDQVDEAIRLEKRLSNFPVLRMAMVKGEVSVTKLSRIASVANLENAAELLDMTKKLSYAVLDVKVKEIRQLESKDVLCEPKNEGGSLCAQTLSINLNDLGISEDVAQKMLELKKKNIDLNALLKEALEKREVELAEEKSVIEAEIEQQEELRQMYLERVIADEENSLELAKRSRYVTAKVRKVLTKEFGDRCSAQGCGRKAVELHHERQFSKGGLQSPKNLQPKCQGHHQLEHWTKRGW